jgi:hypothetical protein
MKQAGLLAATVLLASTTVSANAATFAVTAYFSPATVSVGQTTTFIWNSPTGSFCDVTGLPVGDRWGRSGSVSFVATGPVTAQVSCERYDSFAARTATLSVTNSSPTVVAKFNPTTVYVGGSPSTFSWSTTLASQCSSPQNASVSGTAGSFQVAPTASPSQQAITVNCTNGNGSASHTAYLTTATAPIPKPSVSVWATPDYLVYPGNTNIEYSATNADSCTGQGLHYVSYSQSFGVTCYNSAGSTTAYAWVTMTNGGQIPKMPSSIEPKREAGRPIIKPSLAGANLSHLGIDLSRKRFEYTDGDFNSDGAVDLIVVDKLKQKAYVLLNKAGQYPAIVKAAEQVGSVSQIKGVFVPRAGQPGEISMTVQSQQ